MLALRSMTAALPVARTAADPAALRSVVQPALVLGALICIYWVAVRAFGRGSRERANFRIRSLRGENLGLILGAIAIAEFVFKQGAASNLSPAVWAVGAGVLVALAVAAPAPTGLLVGGAGLVAHLYDILLDQGPAIAAWFIVMTVGLLLLLGVVRVIRE